MNRTAASRLAVALAATLLAGAASAQTLRLVTEESYPFQYMENKKLRGMAVDIVSEMTKRAGVPAEHEIISWKDAYERAQRDRNTCVYSTARLENRERLFHWVGPIVENRWAAFAKAGAAQKPKVLGDLRYVRVGVLEGDAKATYLMDNGIAAALNKVSDDALNPPRLTTNKNEPGKIDAWVTGYFAAKSVAAKTGVTDIEHLFTFETSPNYLACNFGVPAATLQKLGAALEAMKQDGTWQKIVDQYDPAKRK
jgi:polar amino acid transport system substrate-binding protein